MERDHQSLAGDKRTTREIVALSEAGDNRAEATLARYTERLGRALATVINVLDPDIVVLGGGLSNIPELADRAQVAIQPHVFTDEVRTRVLQNKHGDSSGVRGAAWL